MNILEVKNITKYYKKHMAIENISFNIEKGEIFGFIGPNGAGKTTTIKCILNFLNKDFGEVYIENNLITKQTDYLKEYIGYVPSEINLYKDLSVNEMIILSDKFYKNDCLVKAFKMVKKLKLDLNKKIGQLSFGNLKKVSLVLALMHSPKLVILDEATSGLDPIMQEVFYEIVLEEKKQGTTFLFSSHNLIEVKRICDKVGIIKEGKLVKLDKVDNIIKKDVKIVTLIGDYKKLKLPIKDIIIKEKNNEKLKFIYKGNVNDLILLLSSVAFNNILIEEPTIEEAFFHYYK